MKQEDGYNYWFLNLGINKATKINLLLKDLNLSVDAEMYFVGGNQINFAGPITKSMIGGNNKYLNTGFFQSTNITIFLKEKKINSFPISEINIVKIIYNKDTSKNAKTLSSPPNVACYFPEYEYASNAVIYSSNDCSTCSGTIVNTESNNRIPFALSARHCITQGNGANALTQADITRLEQTLFTFFNRTSNCSNGSAVWWQTTGATYIDSSWPIDYLFFRLNETNLPLNVNFWGWDRNPTIPSNITSIHHYNGQPQKISFGTASKGIQLSKYNINWNVGEIASGSSGAGLLVGGKVSGMLSWELGITPSYYTKLSSSWANTVTLKNNLTPNQNLTAVSSFIPLLIIGPTQFCYGQNVTYSMPNLRSTEIAIWSVSSGLNIVSTSQVNHTITVTSNSPSSGFVATIAVTVHDNITNKDYVERSISVRVGFPTYVELSLTNVSNGSQANNGGTIFLISNSSNSLQANHPALLLGANWSFPSSWSTGANGNTYNTIYNWNTNGNSIAIFPTNQCGTSVQPAVFYVSGSYYAYKVFPNPTSTNIKIEFENAENIDMLPDEINIWDDKSSKALKTIIIKDSIEKRNLKLNKTVEFEVSDLQKGLYFIQIKNSRRKELTIESIKIIIE